MIIRRETEALHVIGRAADFTFNLLWVSWYHSSANGAIIHGRSVDCLNFLRGWSPSISYCDQNKWCNCCIHLRINDKKMFWHLVNSAAIRLMPWRCNKQDKNITSTFRNIIRCTSYGVVRNTQFRSLYISISVRSASINGLLQDCSISSALAMETLQCHTKPSIWSRL